MLKETIKKAAHAVVPRMAKEAYKQWWRTNQAHLLRQRCSNCKSLEEVVDLVLGNECFAATQKRAEILGLLKMLQQKPPRRVCEIGGYCGGTLILFAQVACPDARILSVDFNYSSLQIKLCRRFALQKQEISCVQADSHDPATLQLIRGWLNGESLDFLFIDGDHSLSGVRNDFTMYAPLVRPGGRIAFHDIVPDFKTRFGIPTGADGGEVPAFWESLKKQAYLTEELIQDVNQDGMGIGIVEWPGVQS